MSNKKEKIIINTQNRILDATDPLVTLWQEAEKVKKANKGIDSNDVIGIVERALVLIGNAHYVYMTDWRETLLSKLVPKCVDLIEDSSGKRALKKSNDKLFGNKFRKLLAKDSKDNREFSDLLQNNRKGYKMEKLSEKRLFQECWKQTTTGVFSARPLKQQIPVWGPELQRTAQSER